MGGKQSSGGNGLAAIVAFEYEVPVESVKILSETGDRGQGIATVSTPAHASIRYDRMGTIWRRHDSAPPLPQVEGPPPAGSPSNHPVIKFAAADNSVGADRITLIKMQEAPGSGTYVLNIAGSRVTYKKMGTVFMKEGAALPFGGHA